MTCHWRLLMPHMRVCGRILVSSGGGAAEQHGELHGSTLDWRRRRPGGRIGRDLLQDVKVPCSESSAPETGGGGVSCSASAKEASDSDDAEVTSPPAKRSRGASDAAAEAPLLPSAASLQKPAPRSLVQARLPWAPPPPQPRAAAAATASAAAAGQASPAARLARSCAEPADCSELQRVLLRLLRSDSDNFLPKKMKELRSGEDVGVCGAGSAKRRQRDQAACRYRRLSRRSLTVALSSLCSAQASARFETASSRQPACS